MITGWLYPDEHCDKSTSGWHEDRAGQIVLFENDWGDEWQSGGRYMQQLREFLIQDKGFILISDFGNDGYVIMCDKPTTQQLKFIKQNKFNFTAKQRLDIENKIGTLY